MVFAPSCFSEELLGCVFHFLELQGDTVDSVPGDLGLGLDRVRRLQSVSQAIQPWVDTLQYQCAWVCFLGAFSQPPGKNPLRPG